jgi:hypothetical protein
MSHALQTAPLLVALLAAGCGGPKEPDDAGPVDAGPPAFVATQGDFAGFTTWEAFDGGSQAGDSLDGGQRVLYLNKPPPHGSLSFPVGTIVVKTTAGAQTFAMAKRGGGFNPELDGWEWFEIAAGSGDTIQIVWRGTGPSGMFAYANMPATGCTDCHILSWQNDFVAGQGLQLSTF